jgi:ferric-dicitrate binding protein FerR (iron transport regulator)
VSHSDRNEPDDEAPDDKVPMHELSDRWFEGSLSSSQQARLFAWLKDDPERMRMFAEANIRQQMLCDAARGVLLSDQVDDVTLKPRTLGHRALHRRFSMRSIVSLVSIAASLLVAVILFQQTERRSQVEVEQLGQSMDSPMKPNIKPAIKSFAAVTMLQDSDSTLLVGARLADSTIEVSRGLIQLLFDDGVEVTLQGPARYELFAPGRTQLHAGLMTATVPPGAEGFQVITQTAEIVDLGTAFGVELKSDGNTVVSVFEGLVEVTPAGGRTSDKRSVREGESIYVGQDDKIQTAEFETAPFEKVWPAASGIKGSSGAFRFAKPWPRPMGLMQSDSEIFVLPEGYAQTLDKPLRVDVTSSGEYRVESDLDPDMIPAGTRVKCFLLQFRPLEDRSEVGTTLPTIDPDKVKRIVGEIVFDRPVLGLIVRGENLRSSDGLFSIRGGQVPQKGRGLELAGTPRDDIITFSEDRRTVKLDLAAFGIFCDQVRVIVDQSLTK